ncbi:MAG: protein translocase subunit SecF [Patescibacteria group bacterium]
MKLKIIQNRKYNYTLSLIMVMAAIISLLIWGLKPSIDFTGGSLMEIKFNIERPAIDQIQSGLSDLNLGELRVQPAGARNIILRFKTVDEETHQRILSQLKSKFKDVKNDSIPALVEERFESIGPIIGQELAKKAWMAIVLASLAIILYIAFAFRKVSKPVESWKYGVAAVIALIHDILIVVGLFAILGHFAGFEVDSLFITALLTILGFSVHDTIVVFDRTRENLAKHYSADFEAVVNDSINQTIARSINTSLTILLVLSALYFLGGKTIVNFALVLIVGIIVGTYSSIFVASPLVVTWHNLSKNFKNRK